MAATTSEFRNGLCIQLNGELYTVVTFQHVKPGKGGAFVRTKLKGLNTSKIIDKTFNAGAKIIIARIERRPHQFLYHDLTGYHFMDNLSFEQLVLPVSLVPTPQLLKGGQEVIILLHQDTSQPINCELPPFVTLRVAYTEPGFKGDTATKTLKPATLETDIQIQVPLFIENGDLLKIDTRTCTYAERIKK